MSYVNSFNEEIRCEFKVDVKRKKIWEVELDLLKQLERVCQKYDLHYFAIGGTLLGAVRHKGFIPWDDDLDVGFTRQDYDKLCEVAEDEFQPPYFFQTALTDRNYFIGSARLRNSNTSGIIHGMDRHKYNNGIFIDIYVYDSLPEEEQIIKKNIKTLDKLSFILNNYYNSNTNNKIVGFLLSLIRPVTRLIPFESIYGTYTRICKKYNNLQYNSLGLFCIPTFMKYKTDINGIRNLITVPFENTNITIPSNYDFMLNAAYGDYMKFPPVCDRGKWHEHIITFDPDVSFIEYYNKHKDQYSDVLREYGF